MAFGRRRKAKTALNPRIKTLIWATIISLICGVIEFGEPLENFLRMARNKLHEQPASGQIVVIGIDDRSLQKIGQWPWRHRYHAQMTDKLRELGARRIYFDIGFTDPPAAGDRKLFEDALARANRRVVLPAYFAFDERQQTRIDLLPIPEYRRHARLANINVWRDGFGSIWRLPYAQSIEGQTYLSFASDLANRPGELDTSFPIDFSIDYRTVPIESAVDLIGGQINADRIRGKDVVIAAVSERLGDAYVMPGRGLIPGVFFQVIGAETLKKGYPIELGWVLPLLAALAASGLFLFSKRRLVSFGAFVAGLGILVPLPAYLEMHLVFMDIVPGLLLMIIIGGMRTWARFRQRDTTTNPISGLPNLNALRHARSVPHATLVAVRIQNFAEITSTLPQNLERALTEQIASRIGLSADGCKIYHGDEGIFAWLVDNVPLVSLSDQLDALYALFRSPVVVDGRHVDLAIAIGVDIDGSRSLTNRLGSALVAADEAAVEGLRWKEYDAAKLKDVEWRLSLLGRLDEAIDNGEIWVAYQPKLDIAAGRISGAEALVRWSHPDKGEISPEDFVLAAEQHNRIEKLTAHVLNDAIRSAALINAQGLPFEVAVNLSPRLLDTPKSVSLIKSLLIQHKLPAKRLTIEVTESAAMSSGGRSIETIENMKRLGVNIAIDDYGTGFSTLDYLKKIPANEIKIDRSFVDSMDRSHSDKVMVNSTIELAHSLGREVVAEGVERLETLNALEAMGCDRAQGYLIGRPMPFSKLIEIVLGDPQRKVA